ncbi:MAG: hypothetical protein B6I26_06695 [Desulfobacteraceae bacterium 4572_130]|nr:MAG: hypothetical protein B6I26_06695 [Desulfobacteraceae bacterium 4572_130]
MKPLTTSIGNPAHGKDKYFKREKIEAKIWSKIKQNENLLLAAPRRTGKSSILKNLEQNPEKGYLIKYKAVQSVDSINEYFKQIYKLLIEDDTIFGFYKKHYKKVKDALKRFISRIKGFSTQGITIDPNEHIDYYNECKILLKTLPKNFNTLLLLIDEFPDAVKNISNNNDKENGIHFLQLNRDLRQDFNYANIQFIYSGSIGLGNVVKKLNRLDLINDIINIEVPPLNNIEAEQLISRLVLGFKKQEKNFEISNKIKQYILRKESWLIPYYIQIIVDELFEEFCNTKKTITKTTIDEIIKKIIHDRYQYQEYFDNWKTRLKQAFDKKEYKCSLEILNYISMNGSMDYDLIHNLSIKHNIDDLKDITNILEYDGYINKNKEKIYMFNSIILKEWWYINVAT